MPPRAPRQPAWAAHPRARRRSGPAQDAGQSASACVASLCRAWLASPDRNVRSPGRF